MIVVVILGRSDALSKLVAAGADIGAKEESGLTAVHMAAGTHTYAIVQYSII